LILLNYDYKTSFKFSVMSPQQFVFFMGEALLVRNSTYLESWMGPLNLNRLHAALGLLAFVVGVGGIGIKTWQKLERKREDPNATVQHFKSNHGFYGGFRMFYTKI